MTPYINDLLNQRTKRPDPELTWELQAALNEALRDGRQLSAPELSAWRFCTIVHCDGLGEALENQFESVVVTAKFARERGLLETADVLDSAVDDIEGDDIEFIARDGLDAAILDFAAENSDEFTLPAPSFVLHAAAQKKKVAFHLANRTAVQFLHQLLAHKSPRLRCARGQASGVLNDKESFNISVLHRSKAGANSTRLANLRAQYGAAATALLDMIAVHDGCALFIVDGVAAFNFIPSADWEEQSAEVMAWAEEVIWEHDLAAIPTYLRTAIPFGSSPEDLVRWLLITEGEHEGKVILADGETIEDTPRFDSVAEFMATLIHDVESILGYRGYICFDKQAHYVHGGTDSYYPIKYLFAAK